MSVHVIYKGNGGAISEVEERRIPEGQCGAHSAGRRGAEIQSGADELLVSAERRRNTEGQQKDEHDGGHGHRPYRASRHAEGSRADTRQEGRAGARHAGGECARQGLPLGVQAATRHVAGGEPEVGF